MPYSCTFITVSRKQKQRSTSKNKSVSWKTGAIHDKRYLANLLTLEKKCFYDFRPIFYFCFLVLFWRRLSVKWRLSGCRNPWMSAGLAASWCVGAGLGRTQHPISCRGEVWVHERAALNVSLTIVKRWRRSSLAVSSTRGRGKMRVIGGIKEGKMKRR